jgi:hypothetical protein
MQRFADCSLKLQVLVLLVAFSARAEPVKVRHRQGAAHGFVVLKNEAGVRLATGDMTQIVRGDRVTSRLLLRFRDGSIDDDTTVFSERGVFRLISDHHIQRGPSFPKPIEKPRLIQISIKPVGELSFRIGDTKRKATDFVLHAELGGVVGMIAPLIGKQPSDFHIWILEGVSPAFIREEGQLYEGGPIWRIEQISPAFTDEH